MDHSELERLLMFHSAKLAPESLPQIREQLAKVKNLEMAYLAFTELKDPTIVLIISILCGGWGIDRLYCGDVPIGILKLLTCGACGVLWFVDLFLIMDVARRKNSETLYTALVNFS